MHSGSPEVGPHWEGRPGPEDPRSQKKGFEHDTRQENWSSTCQRNPGSPPAPSPGPQGRPPTPRGQQDRLSFLLPAQHLAGTWTVPEKETRRWDQPVSGEGTIQCRGRKATKEELSPLLTQGSPPPHPNIWRACGGENQERKVLQPRLAPRIGQHPRPDVAVRSGDSGS